MNCNVYYSASLAKCQTSSWFGFPVRQPPFLSTLQFLHQNFENRRRIGVNYCFIGNINFRYTFPPLNLNSKVLFSCSLLIRFVPWFQKSEMRVISPLGRGFKSLPARQMPISAIPSCYGVNFWFWL